MRILAATDGRAYILDKSAKQIGVFDGWGGDIAAIDPGCGLKRQIFAALAADPLDHGVIQSFEILHGKAVATSSTVEFPGPITALWTAPNHETAIAVSRDLKTGRYAAFSLSPSCSR